MAQSSVIPDSVIDSATTTLRNLEQLEIHLTELLSLSDSDSLAELPPLERAQSLLLLAKATTILFACNFINFHNIVALLASVLVLLGI